MQNQRLLILEISMARMGGGSGHPQSFTSNCSWMVVVVVVVVVV
jgi:hypothetical protein